MPRDLIHNIGQVQLLAPASRDADATSNILDLAGFNAAMLSVDVGAVTGASATDQVVMTVQESDTDADADFTDAAAADLIGSLPDIEGTDQQNKIHSVGYVGYKRFVRVHLDFQGTPPTVLCAVMGLLGLPNVAPVTAPDPVTAT